jgi:ribosomal protein S18 acetylase RimI-like enzyme
MTSEFNVRALASDTWPAFVRLVEKHNGVWGGCWCISFHQKGTGSKEGNKAAKFELVCGGRAHAALVFDGEEAVGWCQYGRPEDLPKIYHRKAYEKAVEEQPDWRITCFFVDRDYRKRGVAQAALAGALDLIASEGGGLVESFPADMTGKKTSASFLYNATITVFERLGFQRVQQIGMHHWLVVKRVEPKG